MATRSMFQSPDTYLLEVERPIIVDEFIKDGGDVIDIKSKLMTTYREDTISLLPSCDCTQEQPKYMSGFICKVCDTKIIERYKDFKPEVWFKVLNKENTWISPIFISMIEGSIVGNNRFLRWIGDNTYNPPLGNKVALYTGLNSIKGFERTYTWLINNIETILEYLIISPMISDKEKKNDIRQSLKLYQNYRDKIHSQFLPMLSKRLFVLVKTKGMGNYGNNGIGTTWDMVLQYVKAYESSSSKMRDNYMMKIIDRSSMLLDNLNKNLLGGKGGINRKHLHGARFPFSSRCVIVSIDGPHDADEVHLPWGIGVTMFTPHILPKLIRSGLTLKEANDLLFASVNVYNKQIGDILDGLIESSPYKGIPMGTQRNPSLEAWSYISVYITKFNKDPHVTSSAVSALLATLFSGDFDGDEMNHLLHIDHLTHNFFDGFAPEHAVLSSGAPFEVHGRVTLTDPVVATLSSAIEYEKNNKEAL